MTKGKDQKKLKVCFIPYNGATPKIQYENPNCWGYHLKKMLEKDGHSFELYRKNTIQDSDVILCMDNTYFTNVDFFKSAYRYNKLGQMIHIEYEPPTANCRIHDKQGLRLLSGLFKSLVSYNDDVVNGTNIIKGTIGDFFDKEKKYTGDFNKRKHLVAITNNTLHHLLYDRNRKYDNYLKREDTVTSLKKIIPKSFDLYGISWPEELKSKGYVEREKKYDVLSGYKFALSFDSYVNQRGYISEKMFDCFRAKVVPIYLGADNVLDYIPKECFIDYRDFKSNEELAEFLQKMTKKEWEAKIAAIDKFLVSDMYKTHFSSEGSAKILYDEIMKPERKIDRWKAKMILRKLDRKAKKQVIANNPHYDGTTAALRTDRFDMKEIDGVWHLVFDIITVIPNLDKTHEISSNHHRICRIESVPYDDDVLWKYQFALSYESIFKAKKIKLFVANKQNGTREPLQLGSLSFLNKVHYNEENRIFGHGNVIMIKKHPLVILKKAPKKVRPLAHRAIRKAKKLLV